MRHTRRLIGLTLSIAIATPPSFAESVTRPAAPGFETPATEWQLPDFTPQPVTQDISDELRSMMEEGELVAANDDRAPAATRKKKKTVKKKSSRSSEGASYDSGSRAGSRTTTRSRSASGDSNLARARQLAGEGKYAEASKILFPLSRNSAYAKDSAQIKYILGLMLFEMKLYQTAAFVFYDVVREESDNRRNSRYLRQSLEKLSISADALDSDILLKYAIKKVNEEDFPAVHRDMLYFRTGELKLSEKNYDEASRFFSRVRPQSAFFQRAKYKQALAYAESGSLEKAQGSFEDLISVNDTATVTDVNRVSAMLGKARVLYQRQKWDAAIDAYREIPRDTVQWHESLFESTWANLRSARFRSALSNFHSLHSDYYEDFYQPESLILRAIVYVYICRYDEMEKVLGLFDRVYKPVRRDVANILKGNRNPSSFYKEMARVRNEIDAMKANRSNRAGMQIPFLVARNILKEGDVSRGMSYIAKLEEERKRIDAAGANWNRSAVGLYARKVVDRRLQSTQQFVGKLVKRHLYEVGRELLDLSEQKDLLVVETLSGKRETIKKEITGKGVVKTEIEEATGRDYLIQNGYEYWPFKGEYWLDEIGNYHYVGAQACE